MNQRLKNFVEHYKEITTPKEPIIYVYNFMANSYRLSDGSRMLKTEIDKKVVAAKKQKIENMIEEYGYVFCEDCKQNDCKPIDCSHDISVKECQESGRSELAWDVNNITMRGRKCHQKHDKTY